MKRVETTWLCDSCGVEYDEPDLLLRVVVEYGERGPADFEPARWEGHLCPSCHAFELYEEINPVEERVVCYQCNRAGWITMASVARSEDVREFVGRASLPATLASVVEALEAERDDLTAGPAIETGARTDGDPDSG